ncbi:DNA-binding transcriptional regulator, LysR family [Pseudomonas asplenii]|uniref:DNA-binding transcriptional regulator, LysR family n=1 Tax=Pseudomonas asplenii TaxID=53407 RepID=A0A1H1ZSM7_9PSED|nr:LysR family transcriptional regulator [Pseudomonas asplenii]SDT36609.1 DNA-binding transcriptional regulator, LysR family [Pseudomonas asplenii]
MKNSMQHIRAFLTVARTASFTRAADELHLSPSALTVQVQQLEDWLGVALLERSPRQVSLTHAGQQARGPMEKLLLDLDNIVSGSRDLASLQRGVVTIAALPSICAGALPPVLRAFREAYPGVEVRLRDVVAQRIDALVRENEVDFGLGVRARLSHGLDFDVVMVDRLCLFVPEQHPLARQQRVRLTDLSGQPMILTGRDSSVRERVEQLFDEQRLTLVPGLEANYMSTVLALVRQGLGMALLPESADDRLSGLRRLPVEHAGVSREIGLITRSGQSLGPAPARFAALVRERFTLAGNSRSEPADVVAEGADQFQQPLDP